jgi:protein involved in polysaccharide export with SLBB domain
LTGAIQLAGGFTDFASKSEMTLRRANGATERYSFASAVADAAKNPKLDTGDTIQVPSRGFSWRWP